jgi:hypothetical protein
MLNNLNYSPSPVKGLSYFKCLAAKSIVSEKSAIAFFMQWHAFSEFMPDLLSELIINSETEMERINLVKNLYSELGIDVGTESHPKMLKSLITEAYGYFNTSLVRVETEEFIDKIEMQVRKGNSAYNAGLVLALEEVAYEILSVIKEVLSKSSQAVFLKHPYITIHEEVESEHIAHTQEIINLYSNRGSEAEAGYQEMMRWWQVFWDHAFVCMEGCNA